ncbi:hypothetical protein CC2G_014963 [Coprinopsis cinerea AmutBmut pab1-1]|nr:hypothetical protein CC2G_014963 [Coprinopsis cinerea AmutBmut pab1-1]
MSPFTITPRSGLRPRRLQDVWREKEGRFRDPRLPLWLRRRGLWLNPASRIAELASGRMLNGRKRGQDRQEMYLNFDIDLLRSLGSLLLVRSSSGNGVPLSQTTSCGLSTSWKSLCMSKWPSTKARKSPVRVLARLPAPQKNERETRRNRPVRGKPRRPNGGRRFTVSYTMLFHMYVQLHPDTALSNSAPQPHIRPTPILSPSQSESTKIREYKRLPPICLPPHSDPLPPPNVYDRAAWIIPLRGTLPWRDATSAYLLDDSIHDPLDPDIHAVRPIPAPLKSQEPIYWTRPAIAAFWEFLSSLQEGGRVGALGLSFHAARSANISTQTDAELNREISASVHQENTTKDGDSHTSADSASTSARTSCSSPLSSLDYIKVYHPANKSMYVRAALDIWKYEHETWKGGQRTSEGIRLLKGSRLVLLDNLSKAILVS